MAPCGGRDQHVARRLRENGAWKHKLFVVCNEVVV